MREWFSKYRGPAVAGVVLVAAAIAWATSSMRVEAPRENRDAFRHAAGLVQVARTAVSALATSGGAEIALDDRIRMEFEDHLRVHGPVHYVEIGRGRRPVVAIGEASDRAREVAQGLVSQSADSNRWLAERLQGDMVVAAPLFAHGEFSEGRGHGPSPPMRGRAVEWHTSRADARMETLRPYYITAVIRAGVPPHLQRNHSRDVLMGFALLLVAIAALVFAWVRSIRSRDLKAALEAERRDRAYLEDQSLAAAGLAHETRNPIGILHGMAQRLGREAKLAPEHRKQVEAILDQADRAASRLSDYMNFAGVRSPQMISTAPQGLIQRVTSALGPDFEAQGAALSARADAGEVLCDPEMFEQILVNLVSNSLAASGSGERVRIDLRHADAATSLLEVSDEGAGIAPEALEHVFKPYVSGRPDGHGLGLAIVKRMVTAQGWAIDIQSQRGRGTHVRISGIRRGSQGVGV